MQAVLTVLDGMSAEFLSSNTGPDLVIVEDDAEFFRNVHDRTLNALNSRYMLPVDRDEVKVIISSSIAPLIFTIKNSSKRSELHHRLLQFVFGGLNYVGPVKEALQFGQHRRSESKYSP